MLKNCPYCGEPLVEWGEKLLVHKYDKKDCVLIVMPKDYNPQSTKYGIYEDPEGKVYG